MDRKPVVAFFVLGLCTVRKVWASSHLALEIRAYAVLSGGLRIQSR